MPLVSFKSSSIKTIAAILASIVSIIYISCGNSSSQATFQDSEKLRFEYVPTSASGLDFVNRIDESINRNIGIYDYFYNGAGVACADFDNDGLTDIFFTGNDSENRIYKNTGDLTFQDKTDNSKSLGNRWSTGVTLVDINQDGLLDIYVCNSGPTTDAILMQNQLYVNQGDFTFTEQAEAYGIADNSRSSQAVFFDMDNDGDLDLWVMNHSLRSYGRTLADWYNARSKLSYAERKRESISIYENENNRFTDISQKAGVDQPGFGLGISLVDFNEDGFTDVYIANDYFIPDFLYINHGDNSFSDQIKRYMNHVSYYSMGCDAADINNDGYPDLAVVDMTPSDHVRNKTLMTSMNTTRFSTLTDRMKFIPQYMFNGLYLNQGKGYMSDIAHFSNVASSDWSWAPLIADFDNDGFKDLCITTGFYRDTRDNDWLRALQTIQKERGSAYTMEDYFTQLKKASQVPTKNKVYQNRDGLQFMDVTDSWGLEQASFSNGAAYADFDNDGDLDIVVNNLMDEAYLIKNTLDNSNHYIQFELPSSIDGASSLNTQICAYSGSNIFCQAYQFTRGYLSFVQPLVHIGLGEINHIDSVVFSRQQNQHYVLYEPTIDQKHNLKSISFLPKVKEELPTVPIADVSKILLPEDIEHTENLFNEFDTEILLPHAQTRLGPAIAVGDINGDGLKDFYFGGAAGSVSQLFMQNQNGMFTHKQSFDQHKSLEDNNALFVDIDNDNDLDLYVASGSHQRKDASNQQDRLYVNDGQGNYTFEPGRLPVIGESTKAIVSLDWDQDGDLDLFVGGRNSTGRYPVSPKSYFLENENGSFQDVTSTLLNDDSDIGMITDAIALNIDGDPANELVLLGEWMPISIFDFEEGKFMKILESDFENTVGWWQSLTSFDYDNDGDLDLLAGNIGMNNKFHPTEDKPLHVYAEDFDKSGNIDIVLSKYYNDKLVPVRGKECSTEQMPFISKKYESYDAFANASLIDILGEDELKNSLHFQATMFESVLLINERSGFTIQSLPNQAQLFPILDAVVEDLNNDGTIDLILGGNMFDTEVETTAYDAGRGLILQNEYPSEFRPIMDIKQTGLNLSSNVKSLNRIPITTQNIPGIIVGNNNADLQLLLISKESF